METSQKKVELIPGGIAVDDRGVLTFNNAFDMTEVKRFYQVVNHQSGFVRAWHGHRRESKYIYVAKGAALIASVRVEDWDNPDPDSPVERYVLSQQQPNVLFIPGGYAHGYKTLMQDTVVIFFSTSSLEESTQDDFRFDVDYWQAWEILER